MKYYLYCRKSTEESAGKQLNSLESQEQAMLQVAEREGLEVVDTYRESQSASKMGRPIMEQMLSDIQKGKADGILCWKLDRLARNMVEGGALYQMLQSGELKKIRCYDKEYDQSTNAIVFGVELGQATQYSVELKANVNRGMLFKFRNGVWPTMAPLGYINKQHNPHDRYIEIDTKTAPLIRYMFEQYATGQYSLRDISAHIYQKGLAASSGRKYAPQRIKDILTNPFYWGEMNFKGEVVMGNHTPLISKQLFDTVQDVLHGRDRPRPQKHFFPYRGLFRCADCGCSITAEKQKIYHYYHCTGGKGACAQKGINLNEKDLEEQIVGKLGELEFDEELIEIMYQASLEDIESDTQQNTSLCEQLEQELNVIENNKSELLQMRINKELTPEEYTSEKAKYDDKIVEVKNRIENAQNVADPLTTLELTKKVFLTSARAKKRFLESEPEQKREIAFELLSNSLVKDRKVLSFQYKSPYDIIARAPISSDYSQLWTRQDSNLPPSACKADALPDELQALMGTEVLYTFIRMTQRIALIIFEKYLNKFDMKFSHRVY